MWIQITDELLMPEKLWLQVHTAHLPGRQPVFIQAAATENLIQMTSSFLPSDLSGILSSSAPPSPAPLFLLLHTHTRMHARTHTHTPIQPSLSPCSSLNAHPASVYLVVFLSHLASPSTTPLPPRALFIVRLNTASRLSASACAAEKTLLSSARCRRSHLAAALITSHPQNQWVLDRRRCRRARAEAINRFQYGPAGDCEWNSILFCKIVHLLDEQILMAVLASSSSPTHTHIHTHTRAMFCIMAKAVIQLQMDQCFYKDITTVQGPARWREGCFLLLWLFSNYCSLHAHFLPQIWRFCLYPF